MIDKEKHKARWKGKTVEQLESLMVQFKSVVCRTEEETAQVTEAVQVLNELIEEKLQNEGVNHGYRTVNF